MNRIFSAFVILMALLLAFGAVAEPLYVRVIYVRGGGNIPRAQAQRISAQNAAYFSEKIGRPIKVRSFRVVHPFPIRTTLKNADHLLESCEAYNINLHGDRYAVKHCLFPPVVDQGQAWLVGFADGVCCHGCQSVSSAELNNPATGLSRVVHSMIAQRHEWGHILGANDSWQEPCHLMYTGVLYCIDRNEYEILPSSVDAIRSCTAKWGAKKKQPSLF